MLAAAARCSFSSFCCGGRAPWVPWACDVRHLAGCPCGATRFSGREARRGGQGARGRGHARRVRVGRRARDAYLEAGGAGGAGSRSLAPRAHVGARDADLEPGGVRGRRRRRRRARLLGQEAQRHLLVSLARHLQDTQPWLTPGLPRFPLRLCGSRTWGARGRPRAKAPRPKAPRPKAPRPKAARAGRAARPEPGGRCGARRCGAALCGRPGGGESMQPGCAPPRRARPPGGARCDTCWGVAGGGGRSGGRGQGSAVWDQG